MVTLADGDTPAAGRGRGPQDFGPPSSVVEAGVFQHPCEGEAVLKLTNVKIPYFNAPIYLENITQVTLPSSSQGGSMPLLPCVRQLCACICSLLLGTPHLSPSAAQTFHSTRASPVDNADSMT